MLSIVLVKGSPTALWSLIMNKSRHAGTGKVFNNVDLIQRLHAQHFTWQYPGDRRITAMPYHLFDVCFIYFFVLEPIYTSPVLI